MGQIFRPIPRQFFLRDVREVAPDLLGAWLLRILRGKPIGGIIVEVEAYLGPEDPGSHASRPRTRSNDAMWGLGGTAYVYTIHTRYCINVVTGPKEKPQAALLRAIEPRIGIDIMRKLRGRHNLRELCSGPGKLCQALGIALEQNYHDLTTGDALFVAYPPEGPWPLAPEQIGISTRIGLAPGKGEDLPLRFYLKGNPFVSKPPRS